MAGVKVATCCYCGTRAALVLQGKDRHELACRQCGAPLHDLKLMPQKQDTSPQPAASRQRPANVPHATAYRNATTKPAKRKKKSKPRGLMLAKKIWDIVEDIID